MKQTVDDRDRFVGPSSAQTGAGEEEAVIAVVYLDDGQGRSLSCLDLAAHGRSLRLPAASLLEGARLQLSWEGRCLSLRLLWSHPIGSGAGGPWMVGAEALALDDESDEP